MKTFKEACRFIAQNRLQDWRVRDLGPYSFIYEVSHSDVEKEVQRQLKKLLEKK